LDNIIGESHALQSSQRECPINGTSCRRCLGINPHAVGKKFEFVKAWKQDAWGAFVVAERGRVFEYLAWYRPLSDHQAFVGGADCGRPQTTASVAVA
jgi:hypothetical protein